MCSSDLLQTGSSCSGFHIIGLESTAHYGDNLVRFQITRDYKVYFLNPIKTSTMRKNNVRKMNTDKVDTFVIAKTPIVFFQIRPALDSCLCPPKRHSYVKEHCFHAYDSSLPSAGEKLARSFHK